jgi:hypothetical protein
MSSGEEKGDKRRGKDRTGEEKRETIGEERRGEEGGQCPHRTSG